MSKPREKALRRMLLCGAVSASFVLYAGTASADMAAAKKWVDEEFQPSTISKEDQMKEMEWFIHAAEPFKGMSIKVVSETIPTHAYESKTLTQAFEEITGIHVTHDVIQEGDVVEKLQTQVQTGKAIYDGYINDDDFIGFHARYPYTRNLTDWMAGEGKDVTDPFLDLDDFLGLADATGLKSRGFDGKLWQLPDQSFINVYWFRKDWFDRADLKEAFKKKYGYELGVPINWSAYEDIAQFFKDDVKEIDGKAVFGHMDYGKKAPDLGWRFTDDWLGMAGEGDVGIPNGYPVDEWGIRMEGCRPVGSSMTRGGDVNGPAAQYALRKYIEWLREYAPPGALGMDFYQSLPSLAKGNVAQQVFWYSAFAASMLEARSQGQQHGGRERQAALADGSDASWSVLEAGHEGRLSGRRLLDPPQGRSSWIVPRLLGSTRSSSLRKRWTSRSPMSAGRSSARAPSLTSRSTIRMARSTVA